MPNITIYTTRICPFCVRAKFILDKKKIPYQEIKVDANPSLRAEMTRKAGGRYTVPQIWIGEQHVGGCTDLMALERNGNLDKLFA